MNLSTLCMCVYVIIIATACSNKSAIVIIFACVCFEYETKISSTFTLHIIKPHHARALAKNMLPRL